MNATQKNSCCSRTTDRDASIRATQAAATARLGCSCCDDCPCGPECPCDDGCECATSATQTR